MHKTNGQEYSEQLAREASGKATTNQTYTVSRLYGGHWVDTTYATRAEAIKVLRG